MNQETVNQAGSALKNLKVNLIPTDSPLYGRRLVKAIKDASEHGVYLCDPFGSFRVIAVAYRTQNNHIDIKTSRGVLTVLPGDWQDFQDGYGRPIVASRSAR